MSTASSWLPYVLIIGFLVLLTFATSRKRRQAMARDADRASRLTVGTEVMTTSGLYGTVVARSDDDTVLLSIAPGVEVRWAVAALRELEELPERYRPGGTNPDKPAEPHTESPTEPHTDETG